MKILIVEDNELQRKLLEELLKADGFEIIVADSGITALEILKTYTPELIVSDIVMPLMDGFEFAKIIKSGEYKTIPFLIYSSRYPPDDDDVELAYIYGIDRYLNAVGMQGVKDEVMHFLNNKK